MIDDFAESFAKQALRDVAESFFGARSELDYLIEEFESQLERFSKHNDHLQRSCKLLHGLLLDDDGAAALYSALDVDAEPFLRLADGPEMCASLDNGMPFALTTRGRYIKGTLLAYDALQREVHEYLHGCVYMDSEQPGRKCVSVNYNDLKAFAEAINRQAEQLNTYQSPSCIMRFARSMEPGVQSTRDAVGGSMDQYCEELDTSLAFQKIVFSRLELFNTPELPPLKAAKPTIKPLLNGFFDRYPDACESALAYAASQCREA